MTAAPLETAAPAEAAPAEAPVEAAPAEIEVAQAGPAAEPGDVTKLAHPFPRRNPELTAPEFPKGMSGSTPGP